MDIVVRDGERELLRLPVGPVNIGDSCLGPSAEFYFDGRWLIWHGVAYDIDHGREFPSSRGWGMQVAAGRLMFFNTAETIDGLPSVIIATVVAPGANPVNITMRDLGAWSGINDGVLFHEQNHTVRLRDVLARPEVPTLVNVTGLPAEATLKLASARWLVFAAPRQSTFVSGTSTYEMTTQTGGIQVWNFDLLNGTLSAVHEAGRRISWGNGVVTVKAIEQDTLVLHESTWDMPYSSATYRLRLPGWESAGPLETGGRTANFERSQSGSAAMENATSGSQAYAGPVNQAAAGFAGIILATSFAAAFRRRLP